MSPLSHPIIVPLNSDAWINFIQSDPQATIFHHPSWLLTISQVYGYQAYGLAVENSVGELSAALPVAFVSSLITGKRWIAYPFSDFCYPLYRSDSDLALLTGFIQNHCHQESDHPIEVRWALPNASAFTYVSDSVIHFLRLTADFDQVARSIHPMHRRNVKLAEKNGIQIRQGNSLEELKAFYRLHLETRRRQGVPVQPWRFFRHLWENVISNGKGFTILAFSGGVCIAGAVFLLYNETVTYKFGASLQDAWHFKPNNLIFWNAIKWGCENNFVQFDFGKTDTKNSGLREFKSRWGATEQPLIYSSTHPATKLSSSGIIHSTLETVIQKTPLFVGQIIGELLYKHFA